MSAFGRNPITTDHYRAHYRRPVRRLYEHLLGVTISDEDWHQINVKFHSHYQSQLGNVPLAIGAQQALARIAEAGHSQSLLSMFRSDLLHEAVRSYDIHNWFQRIDGNSRASDAPKAESLGEHLTALDVEPSAAILIADTEDDAFAAQHVGARIVLVSGTQHRDRLAATGAPVVDSLADAVATLLDL